MPSIANLTVKKNDGTTDVVYVALQPAAGDNSPALWRQDAYSAIMGNRPMLSFVAKAAKGGTQKVMTAKLVYPELVTDSTTGVQSVRLVDVASATFTMELGAASTTGDECASQFANLLKTPLLLDCIKNGVAPT